MFIVYSKPNCQFCDQAKALLSQRGQPYKVVMVDVGQPKVEGQEYISRDALLAKFPTARTVPQIVFGDDYIGGYTELSDSLRQVA